MINQKCAVKWIIALLAGLAPCVPAAESTAVRNGVFMWGDDLRIRVPLIIRGAGVIRPGSTCAVPVINTDLYPTFLSMAGLPLRSEPHLDGLSLAGLLRGGGGLNSNNLYWHFPHSPSFPPYDAVRFCNGKYDPYELKQNDDPRTYVTDPNRGYGAIGGLKQPPSEIRETP